MKKTAYILSAVAALVIAASCSNLNQTPAFSSDDSFAAFDKLSMSVAESGKKVQIPVSIASIDAQKASISYAAVDGTAKAGENFKLVDDSAVLTFDGEQRTGYIEVEIIDNPGAFTGDITFQIELMSAGDLKIGYNKTCTVTITDNDHPLSDILGWYSMVEGRGEPWEMELRKDPKDVSVVWIYNIGNMSSSWAGDDIMYYGNVKYDPATGTGTISCPLGQASEYLYGGTTPVSLYMLDAAAESYYKAGSLVFTISENGKKLTCEENGVYLLIEGAGYVGMAYAPIDGTKK